MCFLHPPSHLPFLAPPHTGYSTETSVSKAFKHLPMDISNSLVLSLCLPWSQETWNRVDHHFLKLCSSQASVTLGSPNILPFLSPSLYQRLIFLLPTTESVSLGLSSLFWARSLPGVLLSIPRAPPLKFQDTPWAWGLQLQRCLGRVVMCDSWSQIKVAKPSSLPFLRNVQGGGMNTLTS